MRYSARRLLEIRGAQPEAPKPRKARDAESKRAYMREYQRKHRATVKGRQQMHASNLKALYRLSIEQYDDVYSRQQGRCAICSDAISRSFDSTVENNIRGPKRGQAHVDHDHACCPGQKSCGKCLRGLLCSRCNAGLGCFRDRTELLLSAVRYLG